jgi:hypothetical protein
MLRTPAAGRDRQRDARAQALAGHDSLGPLLWTDGERSGREVVGLASDLPVRQATKVDPVTVMRAE